MLLLQQVMKRYGVTLAHYDSALIQMVEKHAGTANERFKDYVEQKNCKLANKAQ